MELVASFGDIYVAALGRKLHRLSPLSSADQRTHPSEEPLRQVAALLVRPEADRQLLLRRDPNDPKVWTLLGGQPGVSYTVWQAGAPPAATPLATPLHTHHRQDSPGGVRGIESLRVAVDLVVDGASGGPPPASFTTDPTTCSGLSITARRLLSGVETTMLPPPILVYALPAAVASGSRTVVVAQGLAPGRRGQIVQRGRSLPQASADANGVLRLESEPISAETSLELRLEAQPASGATPAQSASTCLIGLIRP